MHVLWRQRTCPCGRQCMKRTCLLDPSSSSRCRHLPSSCRFCALRCSTASASTCCLCCQPSWPPLQLTWTPPWSRRTPLQPPRAPAQLSRAPPQPPWTPPYRPRVPVSLPWSPPQPCSGPKPGKAAGCCSSRRSFADCKRRCRASSSCSSICTCCSDSLGSSWLVCCWLVCCWLVCCWLVGRLVIGLEGGLGCGLMLPWMASCQVV